MTTAYSIRFVTMVRHGRYVTSDGDDGLLTESGVEQIQKSALALRHERFDTIHFSTLARAKQSAEVISEAFPYVPLEASDLLRECVPSVPPRLQAIFTMHRRPKQTTDTLNRCIARFELAFRHFCKAPEEPDQEIHDLLVCHGNIIRYFVTRTLGVSSDAWVNMLMHNGGITRLRVDYDGTATLISHNDIGHLPRELRTHG